MKKLAHLKINILLAAGAAILAAVAAVAVFCLLTLHTYGDVIKASKAGVDAGKVSEVSALLDRQFIGDVDADELMDGAAAGMIASLGDRWSYYLPADQVDEYYDTMNNQYVGIGVTVVKAEEGLEITEVSRDSGALDAGLSVGDMITTADGVSLADLTLSEARTIIVGDEGTFVTLIIRSPDGTERETDVERRHIVTESVKYELLDGGVGYVEISNFYVGTADSFRAAVKALETDGAGALVFDVRFNPGGYLNELLDMLDFLLPEGTLFISQDSDGSRDYSYSDAECVDLPMAVLINDSSYSAAEFFAAALREYGRAVTVGQQTIGKGYSQQFFVLSDGSAVNLSTREYFTPNGISLAGVGLTPDIPVEIDEEEYGRLFSGTLERGDDTQLKAAVSSFGN